MILLDRRADRHGRIGACFFLVSLAQADKCLDVTGNNSANGTRLQIWTCAGTANQKWTVG